jgi:hypothetical protein
MSNSLDKTSKWFKRKAEAVIGTATTKQMDFRVEDISMKSGF